MVRRMHWPVAKPEQGRIVMRLQLRLLAADGEHASSTALADCRLPLQLQQAACIIAVQEAMTK